MKGEITSVCAGIVAGAGAGIAVIDLELMAYYSSLVASSVVIIAGIAILATREWPLKLAVAPLLISAVVYFVYSYGIMPGDNAGAFCQIADSAGIVGLIIYVIWNRRVRNERARTAQKEAEKETHTTPPGQMRLVK